MNLFACLKAERHWTSFKFVKVLSKPFLPWIHRNILRFQTDFQSSGCPKTQNNVPGKLFQYFFSCFTILLREIHRREGLYELAYEKLKRYFAYFVLGKLSCFVCKIVLIEQCFVKVSALFINLYSWVVLWSFWPLIC